MKIIVAITLTWSKIMASVIFVMGWTFSFIIRAEADLAVKVIITSMTISAGLLGWRQATNTLRSVFPNGDGKNNNGDDNRISEESSEAPITDP